MKAPYDPAQPIETLFKQIEQGIELANDASNPFLTQQVLTTAYNLVHQTGKYTEDLRDWRRNVPTAEKNLPRFKIHFAAAHREYMEQEMAGQSGYNAANWVAE